MMSGLLLFHDASIYGVKIDFNIVAIFIGTVDFIAATWLFELSDLVALGFLLLFKILHAHPLALWFSRAVFGRVS